MSNMKNKLTLSIALLLAPLAVFAGQKFSIGGLQCEMRVNLVGVDAERP